MSEKEYRSILSTVCAHLDKRARQVGRGLKKAALPAALGAGLALGAGGCSDDTTGPPKADSGIEQGIGTDGAVYMAPDAMTKIDTGPAPEYAAPMDSGTKVDAGPAPEYAAPPPDTGPGLLYMAPDAS